jgi:hypothetical protein
MPSACTTHHLVHACTRTDPQRDKAESRRDSLHGERSRPDVPTYAERPGPHESRAVALVDDCGQWYRYRKPQPSGRL